MKRLVAARRLISAVWLVGLVVMAAWILIRAAPAPASPPLADWLTFTGEPTDLEVQLQDGESIAVTINDRGPRFRYAEGAPNYALVKTALTSPGAVTIWLPAGELKESQPTIWQLAKGGHLVVTAQQAISYRQHLGDNGQEWTLPAVLIITIVASVVPLLCQFCLDRQLEKDGIPWQFPPF